MAGLRKTKAVESPGNRSKVFILFLVLGAVLVIGGFVVASGFLGDEEQEDPQVAGRELAPEDIERGDDPDEGALHNFLEETFGGINDDLQEGAEINASRVGDVEMNAGAGASGMPPVLDGPLEDDHTTTSPPDASPRREAPAGGEFAMEPAPDYENPFVRFIGIPVIGEGDQPLGELADILVEAGTGEARGLVVERDDKLVLLPYVLVEGEAGGALKLRMSAETFSGQPPLVEDVATGIRDISLRLLRESSVVDPDGNEVGDVEAISYVDGRVQAIFFAIELPIEPPVRSRFELGMPEITIIRNPESYTISLSEDQTRYIASTMTPVSATPLGAP